MAFDIFLELGVVLNVRLESVRGRLVVCAEWKVSLGAWGCPGRGWVTSFTRSEAEKLEAKGRDSYLEFARLELRPAPSRPWSLPHVPPLLHFTSCPAHWHLPFRSMLRLRSPYHLLDSSVPLRPFWCRFTPVPACGADSGAASSRYAAGWRSYGAAGGSGRQVRAGEGTREDEGMAVGVGVRRLPGLEMGSGSWVPLP